MDIVIATAESIACATGTNVVMELPLWFCLVVGLDRNILWHVSATNLEFYENVEIVALKITSFQTSSVQNCIHRCQLHETCNVANVKQFHSNVECIFARIECFEKFDEHTRRSERWHLYKLQEKQCKASISWFYNLYCSVEFFYGSQ